VKESKISWTDYSGGDLNFVTGCTPVSEGCKHCYAKAIYDRFGKDFSQVTCHPKKLERLWTKAFPAYSIKRGRPYTHKPMCFVCDTGDLFHEDVPDGFILDALGMMTKRDNVVWQILTKRASKMQAMVLRFCDSDWYGGEALPENIWLGVSVENQQRADERISLLVGTPAQMRFVSIEPCLSAIDLTRHLWDGALHPGCNKYSAKEYLLGAIKWIICGAESGPNRRRFDPKWAEDIYDQCQEAGVSFFGKQDSALYPGKPLLIRGKEVKEWPL